jgi:hypothetical protein
VIENERHVSRALGVCSGIRAYGTRCDGLASVKSNAEVNVKIKLQRTWHVLSWSFSYRATENNLLCTFAAVARTFHAGDCG